MTRSSLLTQSPCLLVAIAALGLAEAHALIWSPPKNPDPHAILNEAREDVRARRYAEALAKHKWFHENALDFQQSLYGVRLSFALSDWRELADKYEPALVALRETRDKARKLVLTKDKTVNTRFHYFHDFESINEKLNESKETVLLFQAIDKDKQEQKLAARIFSVAQPALLKSKQYKLCRKYIEPEKDLAHIKQMYDLNQKFAEEQQLGDRHLDYAQETLSRDCSTLVAMLALNKEPELAEKLAEEAKKFWDDQKFHQAIDEAKKGKLPK
ncbi:hypothetical protein [Adhaeretor mobilis]|uniref:Uncharacterized protein n=1 Tax=Adhaeretor mobilis TaxID=1930276 RepID=A0A517MWW7_9BACT|nr:hypothetical protein [Adhaeretor mobilis]QDS99375.1 hypothetical protein HG15A2_26980 [Adhaeretor mobilis]